jgi:hypothetical protein
MEIALLEISYMHNHFSSVTDFSLVAFLMLVLLRVSIVTENLL